MDTAVPYIVANICALFFVGFVASKRKYVTVEMEATDKMTNKNKDRINDTKENLYDSRGPDHDHGHGHHHSIKDDRRDGDDKDDKDDKDDRDYRRDRHDKRDGDDRRDKRDGDDRREKRDRPDKGGKDDEELRLQKEQKLKAKQNADKDTLARENTFRAEALRDKTASEAKNAKEAAIAAEKKLQDAKAIENAAKKDFEEAVASGKLGEDEYKTLQKQISDLTDKLKPMYDAQNNLKLKREIFEKATEDKVKAVDRDNFNKAAFAYQNACAVSRKSALDYDDSVTRFNLISAEIPSDNTKINASKTKAMADQAIMNEAYTVEDTMFTAYSNAIQSSEARECFNAHVGLIQTNTTHADDLIQLESISQKGNGLKEKLIPSRAKTITAETALQNASQNVGQIATKAIDANNKADAAQIIASKALALADASAHFTSETLERHQQVLFPGMKFLMDDKVSPLYDANHINSCSMFLGCEDLGREISIVSLHPNGAEKSNKLKQLTATWSKVFQESALTISHVMEFCLLDILEFFVSVLFDDTEFRNTFQSFLSKLSNDCYTLNLEVAETHAQLLETFQKGIRHQHEQRPVNLIKYNPEDLIMDESPMKNAYGYLKTLALPADTEAVYEMIYTMRSYLETEISKPIGQQIFCVTRKELAFFDDTDFKSSMNEPDDLVAEAIMIKMEETLRVQGQLLNEQTRLKWSKTSQRKKVCDLMASYLGKQRLGMFIDDGSGKTLVQQDIETLLGERIQVYWFIEKNFDVSKCDRSQFVRFCFSRYFVSMIESMPQE